MTLFFSRSACYTVWSTIATIMASVCPSICPSVGNADNHARSGLYFIAHCLLVRTWEDRHRELCSSRLNGLSLDALKKINRLHQIARQRGYRQRFVLVIPYVVCSTIGYRSNSCRFLFDERKCHCFGLVFCFFVSLQLIFSPPQHDLIKHHCSVLSGVRLPWSFFSIV